jgi:hypothetical protein
MSIIKLPTKGGKQFRPVHEAVSELNQIALARGAKRHLVTAIIEGKRAVAVSPRSKELWSNLATYFWAARKYDEAMACIDRALRIGPEFHKAFHNKGLVCESLGRFDEAEECFAKALAADPGYLNVKWCRSMMRLSLGDYARGWEEYELRIPFRKSEGKELYPKFPAPYWQGEDIKGKKIFCCIEQGIGDTIMFSRWLIWLKQQVGPTVFGGKIYLCCAHELMVLLWEFQLRGILEFVPEGVPIPKCDFSVVTGSLPFHAKCTLETLPPDPGLIRARTAVQMRIGPAAVPKPLGPDPFKVGICWTGNPAQERNDERSIPLELLLTLAEHPNVWLYSLQAGPGQADIARLGADDIICDLGPQLKDRGLTVAATALMQMDLVVTCCTSIAHLAGALGINAWVLLCKSPYWVWLRDRSDSPWYPSLRLFRQTTTDDWNGVVGTARDELIDIVDARRNLKNLVPEASEIANG